jgi:hypothetical protein
MRESSHSYRFAPPLPKQPIPTIAPWLYVLLGALLLAIGWMQFRRR